jgi:hypothetical protein
MMKAVLIPVWNMPIITAWNKDYVVRHHHHPAVVDETGTFRLSVS